MSDRLKVKEKQSCTRYIIKRRNVRANLGISKGDHGTEIFILSLGQHPLLNLEDSQPSLESHVRYVETLPTRIHLLRPSKAPISDFYSPLSNALWHRQKDTNSTV